MRAVLLAAEGKNFCSGGDLLAMRSNLQDHFIQTALWHIDIRQPRANDRRPEFYGVEPSELTQE